MSTVNSGFCEFCMWNAPRVPTSKFVAFYGSTVDGNFCSGRTKERSISSAFDRGWEDKIHINH